jgi:hypothetical protein
VELVANLRYLQYLCQLDLVCSRDYWSCSSLTVTSLAGHGSVNPIIKSTETYSCAHSGIASHASRLSGSWCLRGWFHLIHPQHDGASGLVNLVGHQRWANRDSWN